MSKITSVSLASMAKAFKDAQDIREESFSYDAACYTPDGVRIADLSKAYKVSRVQAIKLAVKMNNLPEEMEEFINIASYWQGDIYAWAEKILSKET